ncbi:TonB-dependent receptor [Dyadobacter frigoris]|nr:TonB-dependent receptor [Dyadobacter frigoris]
MKLTFFLLTIACLHVSASGYSQKLALSMQNVPLSTVFRSIEQQSGYKFFYDNKIIRKTRKVTVDLKNTTVSEIMDQVVKDQSLVYSIVDNIIVVKRQVKDTTVIPIREEPADPEPSLLFRISGTVADDKGEALPGVTVLLKGSQAGTTTDESGKFNLEFADENAVLVFSFVGYVSQEIRVGKQTKLNIVLHVDIKALQEVVVVGYGSQTRATLTGSIASVDFKKVEDVPNTNITQALSGSVAGLSVTPGQRPGDSGSMYLRGIASISTLQQPLIVLDGIIFSGNLSDISPSDIGSLEVLKDASALAIYGSRAASGVILITTKRGASDKPKFSFSSYYGVSDYINEVKLLTPERYLEKLLDYKRLNDESYKTGGVWTPSKYSMSNISSYLSSYEAEQYLAGKSINNQDIIKQDAPSQNIELSVAQKTDKLNYYMSGALTKQKGVVVNDNFKRINLRANLEANLNKWLTVGLNSAFSRRNNSGTPANTFYAQWMSPWGKIYNEDGSLATFPAYPYTTISNPLVYALNPNSSISTSFNGVVYAKVEIPFIKGLTYNIRYGSTLSYAKVENFTYPLGILDPFFPANSKPSSANATGSRLRSDLNTQLVENQLDYKVQLGANGEHSLALTAVVTKQNDNRTNNTSTASNFFNMALGFNQLSLGATQTNTDITNKFVNQGAMFRMNYGYLAKYLVTATIRRDGYSAFGANEKYGNFPSAALAWVASEEKFLKNVPWLDFLKARASYGKIGNQGVSPYATLSQILTSNYVFGDGGVPTVTIYPSTMPNSDLHWESTKQLDLGIDMTLLKNKVSLTLDYYDRKTSDLLYQQLLAPSNGFTVINSNLASMSNRGVEVTLAYNVIRSADFGWTVNGNFSYNKNKILSLRDKTDIPTSNLFIGKNITSVYNYEFNGVWQIGDEIPTGFKAGDMRVVDQDGNGVIDASDRKILGQTEPKWRAGLRNEFRYKDFTLSAFVNTAQGSISENQLINPIYMEIGTNPAVNMIDIDGGWWTPDNRNAKRPSLTYSSGLSGLRFYEKTNYIRIQDITLSYQLPKSLLQKISVDRLNLYVSSKNPFMFTPWSGWDPEAMTTTLNAYTQSQVRGGYPIIRTFVAGLNLTF